MHPPSSPSKLLPGIAIAFAVFAWVLLDERFGAPARAGAAGIGCSAYFANRRRPPAG